ncbi:M1 family metallopeptidase [Aggregicoccus sp. 17bor-14]|uniref:M1 family metallopeptidase n=1 Tax=Myxococcaceae TaxID=31 RepID=UPI00129CF286|nr:MULTISPECIES: M1 family metallopeptidase [Myxococcaceae]MBF5044801.1 M1 family metallopeptidase [Simulacricoccus sp. 17bor-14]MRI90545.1 M1 family metallopeptidase [Aggregicoccus sp. 17bor-14]
MPALRSTLLPLVLLLGAPLAGCARSRAAASPQPGAPAPQVAAAPVAPRGHPTPPALRLSEYVKPTAYALELTLRPEQPRFEGRVTIDLQLSLATDLVWLHGKGLTITRASAQLGDKQVPLEALQAEGDFLGFAAPQLLPAGKVQLRIDYTGPLSEREVEGLFRVKEGDDWYVFSYFAPIAARRAFPCFDEPGFKTPWTLTLNVPRDVMAVANTPQVEVHPRADGLQTFRFAPSEPLPTYLVAFGVGPFDVLEAKPSGQRKVPTRIITPRGRRVEATYAAEVTPEVLGQLERYFGTPYPYAKLDVMAVPLQRGAMENAGLVTYDSSLILSKPEQDTIARQRGFANTQMHELSHQWFGNWVTMAWWDDVWLNESFATWMASHLVAQWQPTWGEDLRRVASRNLALEVDSLSTARRVRQPVERLDDIYSVYDPISYIKGAAVLRMTEAWLGEDAFRRGVRSYLGAHPHGSATVGDFAKALSAEAGRDVAPVLGSFLDQTGAPLLGVQLQCAKDKAPALRLTQQRYVPLGSKPGAAQTWHLPLCVRYGGPTGEARRACTVLEAAQGELLLEGAKGCPAWVMPNADGAGYYRSALEPAELRALLGPHAKKLTAEERVALLGDARALVLAGRLPITEAMQWVRQYAGAPEREVVLAAVRLMGVLRKELLPASLLPARERFVREVFQARVRALGLTAKRGESEDARLLRPKLVTLVGQDGRDEALIRQAQGLARGWLANPASLEAEQVDPVLAVAVAGTDAALHAELLAKMKTTPDRKLRQQLIAALSQVREPSLVRTQLELLLQPELDLREGMPLLAGAAGDVRTRQLAYDFTKAHYDALAARLPETSVARLAALAAGFCSPEARDDAEAFFAPRLAKAQGGARALANALEAVDQCIALKAAQGASAEASLR